MRCAGAVPTRVERAGSTPCARANASRKPGERRTAPAARWAGAVRAQRTLHRPGDVKREAGRDFRELLDGAVGAPVEDEVRRVRINSLEHVLPAGLHQRSGCDEDARARSLGRRRSHERHPLDVGESLVGRRWLELAECAHLGGRREHARLATSPCPQLLRSRDRAEPLEETLDEIDLRLGERRVEPDAPHRGSMSARRLEHVASCGASEIRVVEDDLANARGQLFVECAGELPQGPSALVAVEAVVATSHVFLCDAALPSSRDAHDEDDLRVLRRAWPREKTRTSRAERAVESCPVVRLKLERRRACGGARGLRAPRAGDRNHRGGELQQPGERDLGCGCAACFRDTGKCRVTGKPRRPARPSEWRVGDHRDPFLHTAVDDASPESRDVRGTESDLNRGDGGELERLV